MRKITDTRMQLTNRDKFTIKTGELKGRSFFYPVRGEENWVVALHALLSHFADNGKTRNDSKLRALWVRPLNATGSKSLDAVASPIDVEDPHLEEIKGLEYKLSFPDRDKELNHPLLILDYIVCWELSDQLREGDLVIDRWGYKARVHLDGDYGPPLSYDLIDVQRTDGLNPRQGHLVKVVSLKRLVSKTFDCEMPD